MKRISSLLLLLVLLTGLLPAAGAAGAPEVHWFPEYDFITRMYGTDRMLVYRDGKYGMTDLEGRLIVPCEYAVIRPLEADGTAAAQKGGRWGRIDRDGGVVTPFQYRDESTMAWGATVVEQDGRYGVMDNDGKLVVPCQYYAASPFVLGLSAVRAGIWTNAGYIDAKGSLVGPMTYHDSKPFDPVDGLGVVTDCETRRLGAVNTEGKLVIPCEYAAVWHAGEGIIGLAKIGWNVAFARPDGTLITDFDYGYQMDPKGYFLEGNTFHSGLARVLKHVSEEEWYWGYINTEGEEIIPCQYTHAMDFQDGLAEVGRYVGGEEEHYYIDTQGNRAPSGYPYHEGLRRYNEEKKWGFADERGAVVVPPVYDAVGEFDQGYASVRLDGVYGLLASPLSTETAGRKRKGTTLDPDGTRRRIPDPSDR